MATSKIEESKPASKVQCDIIVVKDNADNKSKVSKSNRELTSHSLEDKKQEKIKEKDSRLSGPKLKHCLYCSIWFSVIVGAFSIYAFVIYYVDYLDRKEQLLQNNIVSNTTLYSGPGCGPDSFMIRDGVCDELTNTEQCLFDGGDCCLEKKIKELCRDCTCKVNIDMEDLTNKFKLFDVKVFQDQEQYKVAHNKQKVGKLSIFSFLKEWVVKEMKSVSDVESIDTCSTLCLEEELDVESNSWVYRNSTGRCKCIQIDITALINTPVGSMKFLPSGVSGMAFVKLENLLQKGVKGI